MTNYLLFNKHSLRSYNCNWANLRNRFFDFIPSENLFYFKHDKNDDISYLSVKNSKILDFSDCFDFSNSNIEVLDRFMSMLYDNNIDCIIGLNIPYSTGKSTYMKDYNLLLSNSSRKVQLHDLLTHASLNKIKICHFVDDCLELNSVDISTLKFYSTDEICDCTYMPFIQYGAFYNSFSDKDLSLSKDKALTAGLKYYDFSGSKERQIIHKRLIELDSLQNDKFDLYYNTGDGALNKKLLRKNSWDREIQRSMYTILTPNQNEKYLSIIRFLEALSVDCIPLKPHWVSSFSTALSKWPDILSFYESHSCLHTDIYDLPSSIDYLIDNYQELIKGIKSLSSIRDFTSSGYYIKYRNQFLDITAGDK